MKIRNLLRTINADPRNIVQVSSDALVSVANTQMQKKHIGALVVFDGNRLTGIFSERDVARGLVEHGPDVLNLRVADLMTVAVISCEPDTEISDAVQLMATNGIRHLPVLEGDDMVGFISMRDIFSVYISSLEIDNDVLREQLEVLVSGGKLGG